MIDDVAQGIQPLLNREGELVMNCTDGGGDLAGHGDIRRAFQAHGERMQARPPGGHFVALLNAVGSEALGDGGNDRRVEAPGDQHAVRYVAHELLVHGGFKRGL